MNVGAGLNFTLNRSFNFAIFSSEIKVAFWISDLIENNDTDLDFSHLLIGDFVFKITKHLECVVFDCGAS